MTAFTEPQETPQKPDANSAVMAMELAERMLQQVASVDEARQLIDMAEMARVYARQARLGTSAINHATTIKMRAEQRMAEIVDEGQRTGQIAQAGGDRSEPSIIRSPNNAPATLNSLGISAPRLNEARLLRDAFTDEDLLARQREADANDEILSRNALVEEARRIKAADDFSRVKDEAAEEFRRLKAQDAEVQSKRIQMFYPALEAIDALASLRIPASEWGEQLPTYLHARLNKSLEQANQWLSELKESWNK